MSPKIVLGTFQNNNYQDLLNVVDSGGTSKNLCLIA